MSAIVEVCKSRRRLIPTVSFVNGVVNKQHSEQLTCRLLGRTDQSEIQMKNQKIMVAESSDMTYVGKNFGRKKPGKSHLKSYIGVYDKKAKKIRVYDTETFYMEPYIPGQDEDKTDSAADLLQKTNSEKMDMLTTAFGSTKRKRVLDTRTRHAIDDATLQGVLTSAIDAGTQEAQTYKQKMEEIGDDQNQTSIPPCNKEASKADDVYNLFDILSEEDIRDLHNSASEFFNCDRQQIEQWRKEAKYPSYVLSKLESMPINEGSRMLQAKCLLYLTYMIQLYRLTQKQLNRKDNLPKEWPQSIRKKLLTNFSLLVEVNSKFRRVMPNRLKDRLVSYAFVLALIIDEFHLNLEDLQKDFRLGRQRVITHARALGCKVANQKDGEKVHPVAYLTIPLNFSTSSPRKKGRR